MDTGLTVEPDNFLVEAGQCFMYLLWSETVMRDLVALEDGGEDMRRRYSEAFGKKPHPTDFTYKRLKLGELDFSNIKDRCLNLWPQWENDREVWDAIERVVFFRNALGHANVQPFRGYLLFTPRSWNIFDNHSKCGQCFEYHKDCKCVSKNLSNPRSVIVRSETLDAIYADIQTVDVECFHPTSELLNIEYRGVAWPTTDGDYMIKVNNRKP